MELEQDLVKTDVALARLARSGGALRLALGTGLDALARTGGHHELGFASVEAYALERCERSARWVQESRWLARRLAVLPEIRRALVRGKIGFRMAQVLATVARPEDEAAWLEQADRATVREMRERVGAARRTTDGELSGRPADGPRPPGGQVVSAELDDLDGRGALTVTVDREDAWLFECAHAIVRHGGGLTLEDTLDALVAEGTTSLLPHVDKARIVPFGETPVDEAQRAWRAELARWRAADERRCEGAILDCRDRGADVAEELPPFDSREPSAIDAWLRRVAEELASRDVTLGRLAEVFWKADGWRHLGYATESQYARERLGISLSSIKAKRALARRTEALPLLGGAVAAGRLGFEAARLVAVVATPETTADWVARARERTVKHLREEVDAAQMLRRLSGGGRIQPPSDEVMAEIARVESRILSGAAFQQHGSQMSAPADELLEDVDRTARDAGVRCRGRVTLKVRAAEETVRYYRWLEDLYRPRPGCFLRYLCLAFIGTWREALDSSGPYASVHARDRYRCTSPVCTRRGVTPHHLRFRAAGGDDSDENVTSLCVWCHLEGVHGGRLHATPPASDIEWTIGRPAHTLVRGRHRVRSHDVGFFDARGSPTARFFDGRSV